MSVRCWAVGSGAVGRGDPRPAPPPIRGRRRVQGPPQGFFGDLCPSGHEACLASRSNARGSGRGLEATIPAKSQGQPSARLAVSGIPPSAHRCGCKLCGAWGSLKLEARLPLWCSRSATAMPLQHRRFYITGWSSFTDADCATLPCRGELHMDGLGVRAGGRLRPPTPAAPAIRVMRGS